jgi:hypothetical protein
LAENALKAFAFESGVVKKEQPPKATGITIE